MFEGAVAGVLHRLLGKYVQDLDTENLNLGIFSGDVHLTDLKLKPEALYELDLPIDVKIGTIGKITIKIPWLGFTTQQILITVEDVLILVGPAISNTNFDPEREKRLTRAAKKKVLEDLEYDSEVPSAPKGLVKSLFTTLLNNMQINLRNVHVRYEDSFSQMEGGLAFGVCLRSLTIETTNSKWKPSPSLQESNTIYKIMKIDSLAVYLNPQASVLSENELSNISPIQYYNWKHAMVTGLDTFMMHQEEFQFLITPLSCKLKAIIQRIVESRVPKLLVDAIIPNFQLKLSRGQYLAMNSLCDCFKRISLNRKYRHLRPEVPLIIDARKWWLYAKEVVLIQRVRPYTWIAIKKHRFNYHEYIKAYKKILLYPNDIELKLDLHKWEDCLPIVSVVLAREEAKFQLLKEDPSKMQIIDQLPAWWQPLSHSRARAKLCVKAQSIRSFWSHLTADERDKVCEMLNVANCDDGVVNSEQHIEHKINITLTNCSLILSNRNTDVLTSKATQLLMSFESRPTGNAYKLSIRAESFLTEGLIKGKSRQIVANGNTANNTHSLSFDIEKNPFGVDADYGLHLNMEPFEVFYEEELIIEILNLFQLQTKSSEEIFKDFNSFGNEASKAAAKMLTKIIDRRTIFNFNIVLKGLSLVVIEPCRSFRPSQTLVIELNKVQIKSELQPSDLLLEDATCMELEEKLYDRLHAELFIQIFFCDSSAIWREVKKHADSDQHLMTNTKIQCVFSNSIRPEYKLLPKFKLNISLSSLNINISDRTLCLLLDFIDNFPLPSPNTIRQNFCNELVMYQSDFVRPDPGFKDLLILKQYVVDVFLRNECVPVITPATTAISVHLSSPVFASERSDEEMELFARSVDLPGFEDNVSPANTIDVLLRFVFGEITINLSRSTQESCKPYLMLSIINICLDAAVMTYGLALQLSINSVIMVDKLQLTDGHYLEMVKSGDGQVVSILYRKVRATCPDFKSHFHSVVQSLVIDVGPIALVLHADALVTSYKYLQYIYDKIKMRHCIDWQNIFKNKYLDVWSYLLRPDLDPPLPPGITKFSCSFGMAPLKVLLCQVDNNLLDITASGIESELVFRAHDKMLFKLTIQSLKVDDLSTTDTLYTTILSPGEEKLLEMKYIRSAPKLYGNTDVKSNGELRVHLGRVQLVLYSGLIQMLQQYFDTFSQNIIKSFSGYVQNKMVIFHNELNRNNVRLYLFIKCHLPVMLLLHKPSSPNLLVFNMGELKIENLFKLHSNKQMGLLQTYIENILLKWDKASLSRAVMRLVASLEVQEPIIESITVSFDVQRSMSSNPVKPHWNANIVSKNILVNVDPTDLATISAVWNDNLGNMVLCNEGTNTPNELPSLANQEFTSVKHELVFIRFIQEGITCKLYSDSDEMLSSPVRDAFHSLAELNLGEILLQAERNEHQSIRLNIVSQSLCLIDSREVLDGDGRTILKCCMEPALECNMLCSSRPKINLSIAPAHVDINIAFTIQLLKTLMEGLRRVVITPVDITIAVSIKQLQVAYTDRSNNNSITLTSKINFQYNTKSKHSTTLLSNKIVFKRKIKFQENIEKIKVVFSCKSLKIERGLNVGLGLIENKFNGELIEVNITPAIYNVFTGMIEEIQSEIKGPETQEFSFTSQSSNEKITEDHFTPKKISADSLPIVSNDIVEIVPEIFRVDVKKLRITFGNDEETTPAVEIMMFINSEDSSDLHTFLHIGLSAYCFNKELSCWEPLVELVSEEGVQRPWTVSVAVSQTKSHPMPKKGELSERDTSKMKRENKTKRKDSEEISDDETILLKRSKSKETIDFEPIYLNDKDDNSDSDDESAIDALSAAIGQLFTDESSSEEPSKRSLSSSEEEKEIEELGFVIVDDERIHVQVKKKQRFKPGPLFKKSTSEDLQNGTKAQRYIIWSKDMLNVTLTPNSLKAISKLVHDIKDYDGQPNIQLNTIELSNHNGPDSLVQLLSLDPLDRTKPATLLATAHYANDNSRPSTPGGDTSTEADDIKSGHEDNQFISIENTSLDTRCALDNQTECVRVQVKDFDSLMVYCPRRPVQKLHVLQPSKNNTRYYLVLETSLEGMVRKIVLRSPLQIVNETSYAMEVWCESSREEVIGEVVNPFSKRQRLSTVAPSACLSLPLMVAYHCQISIKPIHDFSFQLSEDSIWWAKGTDEIDLVCHNNSNSEQRNIFAMKIIVEEGIKSPKISRSIPNYTIRIIPPLTLYNRLPYAIDFVSESLNIRLEPGGQISTHSIDISKRTPVQISFEYSSQVWLSDIVICSEVISKTIKMHTEQESEDGNKTLRISLKVKRSHGQELYFYTSYWIVNKTGLSLDVKAPRRNESMEATTQPCLWTLPRVQLRANGSAWSKAVRPSNGMVACTHQDRGLRYRMLLQVTPSKLCPDLTEIVTVLPLFFVNNKSSAYLRFMEENEDADLWNDLAPGQTTQYWPLTKSMNIHCKYAGSSYVSQHFSVARHHQTVLRLDKGTAITVKVSGGKNRPFSTVFYNCKSGDMPVRIENLSKDLYIKLQQKGSSQASLLGPCMSVKYTWEDPVIEREVMWSVYGCEGQGFIARFRHDGYGEETVKFIKDQVNQESMNSMSSKLSSRTKILTPKLFDTEQASEVFAYSEQPPEKATIYWISYMDNNQRVFTLTNELHIANIYTRKISIEKIEAEFYLSVASIGISLSTETEHRVKEIAYISVLDSSPQWEALINKKFKPLNPELTNWIEEKYSNSEKISELKNYLVVDFEKMQMIKPFFSQLRRIYKPGIWLQVLNSKTSTTYNMRVHKFKIDNQLHDAVYPCVLHPVVQKSTEPYIEISILSNANKNIMVFIGETSINLERSFVSRLACIVNLICKNEDPCFNIRKDLQLVHLPLSTFALKNEGMTKKTNGFIHLSPLVLKLSLTSRNIEDSKKLIKEFKSSYFNYIIEEWANRLCDVKDVILKTKQLNLSNMSTESLLKYALDDIWSELVQNIKINVLGHEVLGNVYYDEALKEVQMGREHENPYKDSKKIKNKSMVHRLNKEMCLLIGHYTDGETRGHDAFTKGPFSGKPFKADDFDKNTNILPESLLKQEESNPLNITIEIEGLVGKQNIDSKRLISQYKCARVDSGRGFTLTIDARCRLPRHSSTYLGISQFSHYNALGVQLLRVTSDNLNEEYIAHAQIDHQHVLLVTTERTLLTRRSNAGCVKTEWSIQLDDLTGVPDIDGDALIIRFRQDELTNYFATDEKRVILPKNDIRSWIQNKIESALIMKMEDKRCPSV